jgi:hypothetical protein
MTIQIHDTDFNGKPLAGTGEYFKGKTATDIVNKIKKNPFQIDLTPGQFMRKVLNRIGKKDYRLTEKDSALEFLNVLAINNYATFCEEYPGWRFCK